MSGKAQQVVIICTLQEDRYNDVDRIDTVQSYKAVAIVTDTDGETKVAAELQESDAVWTLEGILANLEGHGYITRT